MRGLKWNKIVYRRLQQSNQIDLPAIAIAP